jgi:hypothetical protein
MHERQGRQARLTTLRPLPPEAADVQLAPIALAHGAGKAHRPHYGLPVELAAVEPHAPAAAR